MNVTFDKIEAGARDEVGKWIGRKGQVLYVWQDGVNRHGWTYYVVATVPGDHDPGLYFLRVWSTSGGGWALSEDKSLNLAVVFEEAQEA